MSLRLKALCTIALAFSLAGCPETPTPVDAPVTPDGGDGGARDAGRDGGGVIVDGGGDAGGGPVCGNSVVDGTEACDDGNTTANDGCSATCTEETGWSCDGADPTVCTEVCGDGTLVGDEAGANGCDDGGTAADDGCSATCTVEMGWACAGAPSVCTADCGDGAINGVEVCDDGDNVDNDGCSMSCQVETGWTCDTAEPTVCTSTCGDGDVAVGAETCDDGNTVDADGCSATCATESGYDCSTGTCLTVCGDMMIVGAEQCDDGNAVSEACAYGAASCVICASDCTNQPGLTSVCGDGNFDTVNEMCDDGNTVTETACAYGTATCTQCEADCTATIDLTGNVCGDNVVDATNETCDDGNTTALDGCDATCQTESVCGDGTVEGLETCEDGNTTAGDGCSDACIIEAGWLCTGTPSVCVPTCAALAEATVLNCASGTVAGDTTGGTALIDEYACQTFTYPSNEQVWRFTNETANRVAVSVVATRGASTRDLDLYVLESSATAACGDATCAGSSTGTLGTETVNFAANAGSEFFIAYDLFSTPTATTDYTLAITCTPIVCGDGTRGLGETCDDGNAVAGDGCSDTCVLEAGYTCTTATPNVCTFNCGNGTRQTGETCDDGNTTAGDGCSATCIQELDFTCNTATPNVCTPAPYLLRTITAACADMTGATNIAGATGDDIVAASTPLPFAFTYFGTSVLNYAMSSNGNLQLLVSGSGSSAAGNGALPNAATPNGTVAALWDDLINNTGGNARVRTIGTAPSQVFVAEWQNFRGFGTPAATEAITFQAMLYETTNVIEFHYCSVAGTSARTFGAEATIGIENTTGTAAVVQSVNQTAAIATGRAFRFTPR